jgi:hypothetical protein
VAHCPPEFLADLADLFAELRTWPAMVETKPTVFYIRREPFLHFHLDSDGKRHADVKGLKGWIRHDMPRPTSAAKRRAFLRELRQRYAEKSPKAPSRSA